MAYGEYCVETKYGLPEHVSFCSKCVISNQKPNSVVEFSNTNKKTTIQFGTDTICGACNFAEAKKSKIDWQEREELLHELCATYRSKLGHHDVIVPGSGGKDSFYVAHILKHKYNMHPLTVTWAPHKYTTVGAKNFQQWIHAGFDNVLFTPNGAVHRKLTQLAFEKLVHPFQPFILGQKLVGPRLSVQYNIPFVMYGDNPMESEAYTGKFNPIMPTQFYSDENSKPYDSCIAGIKIDKLVKDYGFELHDFIFYLPIQKELLKKTKTTVHYFSDYHFWDTYENYNYTKRHIKFHTNKTRTVGTYNNFASIDDMLDPLHYFTTYIKFGLGRASYNASQDIRTGHMTRAEALEHVRNYDHEFPQAFLPYFLQYLNIKKEAFWQIIDSARSPHLWQHQEKWILLHNAYDVQ